MTRAEQLIAKERREHRLREAEHRIKRQRGQLRGEILRLRLRLTAAEAREYTDLATLHALDRQFARKGGPQ